MKEKITIMRTEGSFDFKNRFTKSFLTCLQGSGSIKSGYVMRKMNSKKRALKDPIEFEDIKRMRCREKVEFEGWCIR